MHVTVAGKQVETGEALQTHVREGLATITQKYFDHALEANVTFRRDVKGKGGAFACDINRSSFFSVISVILIWSRACASGGNPPAATVSSFAST